MEFKNWLLKEMAFTSKMPIIMDEEDINYLQKFPSYLWNLAIQARYSDLILKAVNKNGEIKRDWNDERIMTFNCYGKKFTFKIDSGISKLIKKLKSLRYEIKSPDSKNMTALYYSPMKREKSLEITNKARKFPIGPEREFITIDGKKILAANPQIVPGFARFVPNKFEHIRNDFNEDEKELERKIWQPIEEEVKKEAEEILEIMLRNLRQPENKLYINWYYWEKPENRMKLLQKAVEKIRLNLKSPATRTSSGRKNIIRQLYSSEFQRGFIGKTKINSLANKGIDINSMLNQINPNTNKFYTPEELALLYKKHHAYVPILVRRGNI